MGGGNRQLAARAVVVDGLSPRGRGKLFRAVLLKMGERSIPAWAGETSVSAPFTARSTVYPRVGGGNS